MVAQNSAESAELRKTVAAMREEIEALLAASKGKRDAARPAGNAASGSRLQ